jgi:hypothetical protein
VNKVLSLQTRGIERRHSTTRNPVQEQCSINWRKSERTDTPTSLDFYVSTVKNGKLISYNLHSLCGDELRRLRLHFTPPTKKYCCHRHVILQTANIFIFATTSIHDQRLLERARPSHPQNEGAYSPASNRVL